MNHLTSAGVRPDLPVASIGAAFVAIALALLAIGGVAFNSDPQLFDLWVLALGVYLLLGSLLLLSPLGARWRGGAAGPYSATPLLAEAPARSEEARTEEMGGLSDPWGGPEHPSPPTAAPIWPASSTIAGQYAEVARAVAARRSATRRSAGGLPSSEIGGSAMPHSAAGPAESAYPRASSGGADAASPIAVLENEVERLRGRVAELEGRVPPPRAIDAHAAALWAHGHGGNAPSACAECGEILVGAPDEGRCPSCARPLCGRCARKATTGPLAGMCADCRRARIAPIP